MWNFVIISPSLDLEKIQFSQHCQALKISFRLTDFLQDKFRQDIDRN